MDAATLPLPPSLAVFETLRAANVARQADWCPEQTPDLSFRGNELAGEVGEVCNVVKKLERERLGWRGSRDTVGHLAEELADVVICADLVALSAGIDLTTAVAEKFNATSAKVGLPHRLRVGRDPVDMNDIETGISGVPEDIFERACDLADQFSALLGCDNAKRAAIVVVIGHALAQERESCAFAAETHSGFGDPVTIETCAKIIRTRGIRDGLGINADLVHVERGRFLELLQADEIVREMPTAPLTDAELADARAAF